VKGGRKLWPVMGRSKTAALPEDFCENAFFLAAVLAAERGGILSFRGAPPFGFASSL